MQAKTDASNSNSNSNANPTSPSDAAAAAAAGAKDEKPDVDAGEDEHDNEGEGDGRRTRKRRLGVDPSLIISDGRSKRRRTPSPEPVKKEEGADPKDPERAAMLGREIYTKIMDSKDSDGESMAEPFIKLPPKRQFPDYYEVIKHPMSLDTVDAKLKNKEYQTLKEVITDIGQIFNNAKRYNLKTSLLFIYAKKLHKMTRTFYLKITNPGEEQHDSEDEAPPAARARGVSSTGNRRESTTHRATSASAGAAGQSMEPDDDDEDDDGNEGGGHGGPRQGPGIKRGSYMKNGPTTYKLVKPVMKIIKETKARDGSGRDIAGIFEFLPDRKDYSDYYVAIKNPISLAEIDDKMVGRKYETWEEFFDDCELMCANAMEYNEDASEVYQDALHIKEILDYNRAEIKTRLTLPISQQRQRLKPVNTPSRQSAHLGTPGSAGSHSLPLPGDGRRTSGSPMPGSSGYYGSPLAATSNSLHPHIPANPHAPPPAMTPGQGVSGSAYPTLASVGIPSRAPAYPAASPAPLPPTPQFRAPLPLGHVSESVINTLSQYTEAEKRAWIGSLSQSQLQTYRTLTTTAEARRRVAQGLPPPPLAEVPSAARPAQSQASGSGSGAAGAAAHASQVRQVFKRAKPAVPGIKAFEFGFEGEVNEWEEMFREVEDEVLGVNGNGSGDGSGNGNGDVSMDGTSPLPTSTGKSKATRPRRQQRSIRLHNLRGVGTHALLVDSSTTQVTLSAYYSDFILNAISATTADGASSNSQAIPQATLKLNGVPVNGQTALYEPLKRLGAEDDVLSQLLPSDGSPRGDAAANGADTVGAAGGESGTGSNGNANINSSATQKAKGVQWTVNIPAGQAESTLSIVLVRPAMGQPGAGSVTELSTIYVARQF